MTRGSALSRQRMDELVRELPYGVWRCVDGREVLFNRNYEPLWQRHRGQIALADSREWVDFVSQVYFYEGLESADQALITRLTAVVQAFCAWRPMGSLDRSAA